LRNEAVRDRIRYEIEWGGREQSWHDPHLLDPEQQQERPEEVRKLRGCD
jgi:hypothetical protein